MEKNAWKSFENVTTNFLINQKAENDRDMEAEFAQSYKAMECNTSLKVQLVDSHLFLFAEDLEAVSNEHGERLHLCISTMERRYKGMWSPSVLADYCWTLRRDVPQAKYSRKSTTAPFYMFILSVI